MKKLLYVLIGLMAVVACEKKKMSYDKNNTADSIINKFFDDQNYDKALVLVDSFEKTGDITLIHASEKRGEIYLNMNKMAESEAEFKKATDGTTPEDLLDTLYYYSAITNIVQFNALHNDEEAVMTSALSLLQALDEFKCPEEHLPKVLRMRLAAYTYMGAAQAGMEKFDEVDRSYENAYKVIQQLLDISDSWSTCFNSVIGLTNFVSNNLYVKRYDQAAFWMVKTDSLAPMVYEHKDVPDLYKAMLKCSMDVNHLNLAVGQNKMDEAARYYAQLKNSPFFGQTDVKTRSIGYLMASQRYAEAADILQNIDEVIAKYKVEPTLDLMSEYLVKKFEANQKAGRRDSAMAVATFVFENLDSAITRQKRNESAKLATIYETKQKDDEIAQQQIDLNHQRIFALLIAIGLITAFFIIYTIIRRRAAMRMAEMKARQERIESELRIARDIQMSMVPSTFPDREGLDLYAKMTPAKEVGGDLYGYVLYGDNLYFAVGDVSGKGVPASLFMAQATRLFRTMAVQGLKPEEICTRLNQELSGDDNVNGMFVTMFIGLLDMNSGHLSYCNAGHNPPVLGGGDNKGDFLQMEANAPIGLFPGVEYVGEEIENIKGRALFVYTDGLNEAEDLEKNQFGDEKLLAILRDTQFDSAQQVIDTLGAKVEEHRNGAEPNDDLTMLCLRVS